ncbi:hypothetical protein WR25_18291 isoform A [Diploscapter pachys]|uniref:Saposin B-type domain-containing protein n=1 Tax=Diploscapter pachys TaxID=2018661 RepID=A0A2A2LE76_9BILA|nr:hypothetical protein WR25_18291 isoform A [Diploscapter pachys]
MQKMFTAALVALSIALSSCMPADLKPQQADDNCGAVDVKRTWLYLTTGTDADVGCEICLDLVLIAETYSECEEAVIEHHCENYCKEKTANKAAQMACVAMIDDVMHEVITDTEQDPTAVCHKVIHRECHYFKA